MNALDVITFLQERERHLADGALRLIPCTPREPCLVMAHPQAIEDLLNGEHGVINAGFEMGLLADCIGRRVIPSRRWPGLPAIIRYDLLEGSISAALAAMADGRYCVLGFFPKPGEN